jgi:hypothetical protein
MNWTRHTTPNGVPFYLNDNETWRLEADQRVSTHVGMVFGQYVNDADARKPRTTAWRIMRIDSERPDGWRNVSRARTLKAAKAYVERYVARALDTAPSSR